jgi:hypothetical protein
MVYLSTTDIMELGTIARESQQGQDESMIKKFMPLYIGPYEVLEVCGHDKQNRKLKITETLRSRFKHKGSDTFHVSKLKTAWSRANDFDITNDLPPPSTIVNGEEEFHIENIVEYDCQNDGNYFRIKWLGYENTTIEHESMLENECPRNLKAIYGDKSNTGQSLQTPTPREEKIKLSFFFFLPLTLIIRMWAFVLRRGVSTI